MGELQTLETPVVASKAEQPMIVSQHSLLQAVTYLRSELDKIQNEKKDLARERTSLLEQLEIEKNKNNSSKDSIETAISNQEETEENSEQDKTIVELRSQLERLEKEKQELIAQEQQEKQSIKEQLDQAQEENENFKSQLDQAQEERQNLKTQLEQVQEEKQNLKAQLEQTQEEKRQLEVQHQSLIAKLANFKTSIADKLKTDMEDLNQKRQQIEELNTLVSELQLDLATSRNERENTAQQLQTLEAQLYDIQLQTSHEISEKDKTIRDLQINLDRSERERLDGEVTIMELKSAKDELLSRIKHLEREMETLKHEKETLKVEKDNESESLNNLQNVLEEFEAAKQSEIREAVEGIQRRLSTATKELTEFKDRALLAENQLTQIKEEVGRTTQYEKEIKEKNILIGKLRHEAVILNEHLTEALRRMREESSENNVDRRLITNLLIAFFNTPRGDSKRFEILQLMASMLQWNEEQKEQVGLIRKASKTIDNGWTTGLWTPTIERPRSRLSEDVSRPIIRISEEDDQKESFSDMWISFLLKEASKDDEEQKVDNSSTSTQSE
ncbi:1870_t:CDS:2 [Acaulospora morrowiae]|uniref:1870_t:CDS:1 n=1 Tax=Acaulospora morrowiae TaxID=94023 RepID=A0A9N9G5B6_9GLOM|nr:1870_t:CDS:2 [Acaulospora morrowiae]